MQLDKTTINTLAKKREVPYEIMFKLSDAKQDQIKKNKYWFDFPQQWVDQLDKDAIIGIRDIYLTKTNRHIKLKFSIAIVEKNSETIWGIRRCISDFTMDGEDTIKTFTNKFNESWFNSANEWITTSAGVDFNSFVDYEWNIKDFNAWFDYDNTTKQILLKIGCSWLCPETVTIKDTNNQTHTCYFKISFQADNDDTIAVLGTSNVCTGTKYASTPIWTRYAVYILSSLAEDDRNGFLGHSRPLAFNPIKYYRIKNKDKKFWIELYETRYHDVPVTVLPNDNRDDLFIEAIVTFSSSGML